MNRFGERIRYSSFQRRTHALADGLEFIPTETKKQIREAVRSQRLTAEQAARQFELPLALVNALLRR